MLAPRPVSGSRYPGRAGSSLDPNGKEPSQFTIPDEEMKDPLNLALFPFS